jgi:hypothetical protein
MKGEILVYNLTAKTCRVEKCEILNKYFCSITDLEDDGIDLPDFDDRGCNTLTTIVVSEQDALGFRRAGTSLVGRSLLSNILIVL